MQLDHNKLSPESLKLDIERQNELLERKMNIDIEKESDVIYAECQQSKISRIMHKILYIALWLAALALIIASNVLPSSVFLFTAASIAVVVVIISFAVTGYFLFFQLRADNEMNYYMYLHAVKKFGLTVVVSASIITAYFILIIVLMLVMSESLSSSAIWIIVMQVLAAVMIWIMAIAEKNRKIIIRNETPANP